MNPDSAPSRGSRTIFKKRTLDKTQSVQVEEVIRGFLSDG